MDDTFKQMKEMKTQWEQHEENPIETSDSVDAIKIKLKESAAKKQHPSANPSPDVIKWKKKGKGSGLIFFSSKRRG